MRTDPLAGKYLLKCTHPGCHGQLICEANFGLGWAEGQQIPLDNSDPARARCPVCKRHNMLVASAPPKPKPPGPKGFTKVPTE